MVRACRGEGVSRGRTVRKASLTKRREIKMGKKTPMKKSWRDENIDPEKHL